MYPNTRIEKISLINFKNHLNTNLEKILIHLLYLMEKMDQVKQIY